MNIRPVSAPNSFTKGRGETTFPVEEDIAVVRVTGGDLQNQVDAVRQVLEPLADARIYLHDVVTSATCVSVFVAWRDREATLDALQDVL